MMSYRFWQRVFSIFLLLGLVMSAASPIVAAPVAATHETKVEPDSLTPTVIHPVKNDVSPALRTITPAQMEPVEPRDLPLFQLPKVDSVNSTGTRDAPSIQTTVGPRFMPGPLQTFEGISNLDAVYPPDTEGDIGLNHYIQWVNLHFAIWEIDKINNTATLVYGPAAGNTFWSGFGGPCQNSNDGDPIALYDPLADRWLMSQFAVEQTPSYQCIAISTSNDPLGTWYRYAFIWPGDNMNDYPKFGVWPDAYYMTANQFSSSNAWAGAGVAAFNRVKMIAGDPAAEMVYFDLYGVNPNFGGMLPADFDGITLPPLGAPGLFAEWDDSTWIAPNDALRVWEFHVDFATPANSTFGINGQPNFIIPTMDVDPDMCGYVQNCIPQPGTGVKLDAISDRLMYRLQYRNFGSYQTLVSNHTVDATGGDIAGIHWFELRDNGTGWGMEQEGVYHPDNNNRWMGSAALDHVGDLALGYSVSSTSVYPSIRYAGRLVSDPSGTLPQAEQEVIAGSGYQSGPAGRWGDYSMMAVDPSDDCTFWYTQEYIQTSGTVNWQTRVAAFKFPDCSVQAPAISVDPTFFEVNVTQGYSLTVPLHLINSGNASSSFELTEKSGGFIPALMESAPTSEPLPLVTNPGSTSVINITAPFGTAQFETPRPDSWTGAAPYPQTIVRYAQVQCPGDYDSFYIFGGVSDGSVVNTARRYDANINTWTSLAPMPFYAEGPTGVCYEGKIYVTEGGGYTHFNIYDIATNAWSSGADLSRGVLCAAMAAWNGNVYLIGGDNDFIPGNGVSDQVNIYDIASNTWIGTGTSMPSGVSNVGFVQLGQYVYIVGGWSILSPGSNSNLTQRYDLETDTWETGPAFTPSRADFPLAATSQYLYAMGGDQDGGGFFDSSNVVWRYDFNAWPNGAWADVGDNLPYALQAYFGGFTTDSLTAGEIWSVGGLEGATFTFHADNLYRAAEPPWTADVPWLSEFPVSGTVDASSVFDVAISFDSMTYTLGTYTATLILNTDDPVVPKIDIPVTMHVVAAEAPVVSFTSNSPVMVGNTMVFTNTSNPGLPPTDEYVWDFGDSITMTVPTADPVTHVYATYGTFTVTLEACNVLDCDTFTAEVVVEPIEFFLPMVAKQ
jgi:PKD domain/Kelch motif